MWLRLAERWARGSGAGAAAQEANASAASSSRRGRVRRRMLRRAHCSRQAAVCSTEHTTTLQRSHDPVPIKIHYTASCIQVHSLMRSIDGGLCCMVHTAGQLALGCWVDL
ncbi:unnamed protein product [Danaus chrysippus]|uniref:(African queen) hypothetical protein n=1 Tax=Danaus chrysippus TaxID=151541 RepID=A0A8J2QWB1_9NEOP|nr:unnamed protein product [Danaus chrysippus]